MVPKKKTNEDLVADKPQRKACELYIVFSGVKNDRYEYLEVFNFLDYSEETIFQSQLLCILTSFWVRSNKKSTENIACQPALRSKQKQFFCSFSVVFC